jgi:hypothetical protein
MILSGSALYPQNPRAIYVQSEGSLDLIDPEPVLQSVAQILSRPPAEPNLPEQNSGRSASLERM